MFVIDDPLVVFGGGRRWNVEHPHNSVRIRRPSGVFWRWRAGACGILTTLLLWSRIRPDGLRTCGLAWSRVS